ncbi:Undecaprenyl-phosphate galactose phosphotransferase WbaP [Deinococcus metalli]|uniref:Undecaprenyl-phosphate galactose phosphotransferase WbaP n=1 Tax=Deinococcus metalli TaxID=1141878 RepID=A0A7W8KCR1_9DEIO|nr:undecaprenyl-phosphate galactose phosphotransferase WbaP [Deinococcus metalli]MBB5375782.1 Undecaprenyl-phosphate galactose phosphotransferase WbaP [Deinococcus metalli]GHF37088.1 undecaprenyl-phosphate galactose phosphotransferase WbaP [Deinococcus metalli]
MGVLSPTPIPMQRRSERAPRLTSVPQGLVLLTGDVLALALALLMTSAVFGLAISRSGLQALAVWGGLWLIWRAYQGLYPGYGRSPQTELRLHVIGTLQLVAGQLAAALATQRFSPSFSGIIMEWSIVLVVSLILRYYLRANLVAMNFFGREISIIGAGRTAEVVIAHLRTYPAYGLKPVVAYDDNVDLHGTVVNGVRVVGPISMALETPLTEHALLSIPGARAELAQRLVNSVYASFPYTWIIPDLFGMPNQALQAHNIGTVASLEIRNNLRSLQSQVLKRVLDFLLGLGLSLLLLPLLALIALLIRLDSPGPVLFAAPRLGRQHRVFNCYKFRSMHFDAEERLHGMLSDDPALRDEYETYHKLKSDPRVTRVGYFLRKYSLDELPQIFNILLGHMSMVGPRPYLVREQHKLGSFSSFVLQVRPGITGYWQVSGRNTSTFEERMDMDKFYITNWTPWLDLMILLRTVGVVLRGHGAY